MLKQKGERVSLPKIKKQKRLPTLEPIQIEHINDKRFVRYNTEIQAYEYDKYHKDEIELCSYFQNHQRDKSRTNIRQNRHTDLVNILDSNRKSSLTKEEKAKIIDARKSIKILVDYFNSETRKSRQGQFRSNFTTKKKPVNLVEMRQISEEYKASKKNINEKKKQHSCTNKQLKSEKFTKMQRIVGKNININPYFKTNNTLQHGSKTQKIENMSEQIIVSSDSPPHFNGYMPKKKRMSKYDNIYQIKGWETKLEDSLYIQ